MLVKQHGQDAPIQAAMRADELLEMGDVVGVMAFLGVLALVVFEALVPFVDVVVLVVLVVFETLAILTFLVSSTEPSGEPDLDVLLLINLFLGLTRVGLR